MLIPTAMFTDRCDRTLFSLPSCDIQIRRNGFLYGTRSISGHCRYHYRSYPIVYTEIASLVPEFPRLFPRPDSIPQQQPTLDAFDVNQVTKILFPDIINISNVYSFFLFICFIVAFLNFEGIELLQSFNEEKSLERLMSSMDRTRESEASEEEARRKEKRRGLGWLAIITAITVWCAGVINNPNPLQP